MRQHSPASDRSASGRPARRTSRASAGYSPSWEPQGGCATTRRFRPGPPIVAAPNLAAPACRVDGCAHPTRGRPRRPPRSAGRRVTTAQEIRPVASLGHGHWLVHHDHAQLLRAGCGQQLGDTIDLCRGHLPVLVPPFARGVDANGQQIRRRMEGLEIGPERLGVARMGGSAAPVAWSRYKGVSSTRMSIGALRCVTSPSNPPTTFLRPGASVGFTTMWWNSKPSTPAASPSLPIAPCSIRPIIDNVPTGRSISAAMLPSPDVPASVSSGSAPNC
jgi:hypothetical protein